MTFSKNGYEIVRNVFSKDLLNHLKTEFELMKDVRYFETGLKDKLAFGDDNVPKSYCQYAIPAFEALSIQLKEQISQIVDKELYSTYTYARIYYKGADLPPHKDRPSCEFSTTICIDSTELWDFYIDDRDGRKSTIKLNPGDMCVYDGCNLTHWRETFQGEKQMQVFLHYVNVNGPNSSYKYDERPMLGTAPHKKYASYVVKKSEFDYK
jgi:hypothetical protein|tara:strand:- start:1758 stop:2384 length:627 start_codon:yes stop_codon:yes gene_type:complete